MQLIKKVSVGSRLIDGATIDALIDNANGLNVVPIAGTAYTLLAADLVNQYLLFTNANPVTFTIPNNSTLAVPIGTQIPFEQYGAGLLTIAAAAGVTVNSRTTLVSAGQHAVMGLVKVGFNIWTLYGDIAAS